MGINRQTEISNGIFNLFTLVETHTTINPVWNTQVTQLILYHTRLSIRAVHHRNIFITNALTVQYLHLLGYCLTLIPIGHIATQLQSIPQCQLRIYRLRNLTTIMTNQRVRGVHNGLGRTIITLQLKQLSIGISLLESQDILNIRTAERINRLSIISHHANMILWLC